MAVYRPTGNLQPFDVPTSETRGPLFGPDPEGLVLWSSLAPLLLSLPPWGVFQMLFKGTVSVVCLIWMMCFRFLLSLSLFFCISLFCSCLYLCVNICFLAACWDLLRRLGALEDTKLRNRQTDRHTDKIIFTSQWISISINPVLFTTITCKANSQIYI